MRVALEGKHVMTGRRASKNTNGNKQSLRQQLATRLRELREHRGWSQERLSEASGLHRTFISQVERGRCNIIDNIERLARALQVSATALISSRTKPAPQTAEMRALAALYSSGKGSVERGRGKGSGSWKGVGGKGSGVFY